MTIDWASFTPWASLAGGALIGLAATILVLFTGRIAGVSGILGGLLRRSTGDVAWRLAFVAGLVVAPLVYLVFAALPPIAVEAAYPTLLLAGLAVGIGTRYAGGCTSGHGVCGMSRLSVRSIVATLTFMATAFATVFVVRHVIGG